MRGNYLIVCNLYCGILLKEVTKNGIKSAFIVRQTDKDNESKYCKENSNRDDICSVIKFSWLVITQIISFIAYYITLSRFIIYLRYQYACSEISRARIELMDI